MSLDVSIDEDWVSPLLDVLPEVVDELMEVDDCSDVVISEDNDELAHEDMTKTMVAKLAVRNLRLTIGNAPRLIKFHYLRTLLFSAMTSISISGSVNPA